MCWKSVGAPSQCPERLGNWAARGRAGITDGPLPQNWTGEVLYLLPSTWTPQPAWVLPALPSLLPREWSLCPTARPHSRFFTVSASLPTVLKFWVELSEQMGHIPCPTFKASHFWALPPDEVLQVEKIPQTQWRISSATSPKYKCL